MYVSLYVVKGKMFCIPLKPGWVLRLLLVQQQQEQQQLEQEQLGQEQQQLQQVGRSLGRRDGTRRGWAGTTHPIQVHFHISHK
jgi:diadenosine tetraphosphate (Ap4A) HIT family hydrolase